MESQTFEEQIPIHLQVRKWKEDCAARYNFDPALIARAAQKWEAEHPERMADPKTYQRQPELSES